MKQVDHTSPVIDNHCDPNWAGFLVGNRIINIALHRSGGQAVLGGKFPCPGEAPSLAGVPPLRETEASPGAPRFDNLTKLEYLRLQISHGEYLTDKILEETAERFLKTEILEDEHDP
jgi:hypothetical protein